MKKYFTYVLLLVVSILCFTSTYAQNPPALGLEFLVNDVPSGTQQYASVDVNDSGDYVVVWESPDASGTGIFARRYDNTHTPLGNQFQVNTTTSQNQSIPRVTVLNDGSFVVIWHHRSTSNNLKCRIYDANGIPVTGEFSIATQWNNSGSHSSYRLHHISSDGVDRFVVAWITTGEQVQVKRFNMDGTAFGGTISVSETAGWDYRCAAVAMHADESFVVAYVNDASTAAVVHKRYNATGVPTIPESNVFNALNSVYNFYGVDVDMNSTGEYVITANSKNSTGWRMFDFRKLDATGAMVTGKVTYNSMSSGDGNESRCAINEEGGMAFSWYEKTSGNPNDVHSRIYDPSGAALGGEFTVSTTTADEQRWCDVVFMPDNTLYYVWNGNGFMGDATGIYARRFDAPNFPGITTSTNGVLTTSETGSTASFDVVLNTQPTDTVFMDVTSTNTAEGMVGVNQIYFTDANWDTPQTIVIMGVDDVLDDGDINYDAQLINIVSNDAKYNNLSDKVFPAINLDDDATYALPSNQFICQNTSISNLGFQLNNVGGTINTVNATSDDQTLIPNGNISVTDLGGGGYELDIIPNVGQNGGPVGITIVGQDNNFNYDTIIYVTIYPLPIANAGSDAAICEGTSITLTATGGTSYTWDNGLGVGASHTVAPTTTTTYMVTVTDGNGCVNTDAVEVTVNPLPIANAGSDVAICEGVSTTLTATGGASYTWDNGLGAGASHTVAPTTTTTYMVTVTDGNGCANTDVVEVTVNPLPTANAGSDVTICEGASTTLTATGGTSYTWDNGLGAGASHTVAPITTTTYMVTVTDGNGCVNTDVVEVVVNPLPNVLFIGLDSLYCLNYAPASLTGSPVGGIFSGAGMNGNNFDPATAGVGTHQISYNYTDGTGCANADTQTVVVDFCTGIDRAVASTSSLLIYPNPNNGQFQLQLNTLQAGNYELMVLNALGQAVYRELV